APPASRLDRSRVPVARERMQLSSLSPAEQRNEHGLRDLGELTDRGDPELVEARRRRRPDTPDALDLERMQEVELVARLDDEQPVRLRDPARHLGEELRPRDPHGERQPDLRSDPLAQPRGDLDRRPHAALEAADVEERLVDREPLDDRRRVLEEPEDVPARLRVRLEPRRHRRRVRAQPARGSLPHPRADAERLRLVARREDDAHPDEHGPAAQARVVPLLDGGEEAVQVRVEDRRGVAHRTYVRTDAAPSVRPRATGRPRRRRSPGAPCCGSGASSAASSSASSSRAYAATASSTSRRRRPRRRLRRARLLPRQARRAFGVEAFAPPGRFRYSTTPAAWAPTERAGAREATASLSRGPKLRPRDTRRR